MYTMSPSGFFNVSSTPKDIVARKAQKGVHKHAHGRNPVSSRLSFRVSLLPWSAGRVCCRDKHVGDRSSPHVEQQRNLREIHHTATRKREQSQREEHRAEDLSDVISGVECQRARRSVRVSTPEGRSVKGPTKGSATSEIVWEIRDGAGQAVNGTVGQLINKGGNVREATEGA